MFSFVLIEWLIETNLILKAISERSVEGQASRSDARYLFDYQSKENTKSFAERNSDLRFLKCRALIYRCFFQMNISLVSSDESSETADAQTFPTSLVSYSSSQLTKENIQRISLLFV